MIKGFRFTNQLANAEVDARIHQEFLNKNDGIFYGMDLSKTNNSITISEGLCEIAGRPVAVINNETVAVGAESLYCLLILEIDLSKDSTKDVFNQATFKLLTSSSSYPTVTQQDINKYNGENNLYQLEFARFRSGTSGITDFKDTRKFLNFNGIYAQIKSDCEVIINQIKQKLKSVEDESAYMLNKVEVANVTLEGTQGVKLNLQFKKTGHIVYVKTNIQVPANVKSYANIFPLDDVIPEFAKTNEHFSEAGLYLCEFASSYGDDSFKTRMYVNPEAEKHYRMGCALMRTGDITQVITLESFMSYVVDEEVVTEDDYILGDVNLDGKVNVDDQLLIKDYIMNEVSLTDKQFKAADMNKDGKVDTLDYTRLGNQIAEQYSIGDINTDGVVDEKDLDLLSEYLKGNVSFTNAQQKLADVNKDGKIDSMDSYKIQQYILNGTPLE